MQSPPIKHTTPPPMPRINGPRVVGTTSGRPFLFLVPAAGEGTLSYTARGLPPNLSIDKGSGIITGSLEKGGTFPVTLRVSNQNGSAERVLIIIGGEHVLALTPPMGWNAWNAWGHHVDDAKIRTAIDCIVSSGLASHGYAYVNIDDTWEGNRCPNRRIRSNTKFPDMKALADHAHSKGLKLGIYSSPGPKTCGGYEGSLGHEALDAATFANWGIDYLKYDWCSYTTDRIRRMRLRWPHFFNQGHVFVHFHIPMDELKRPYVLMRAALDGCGRDIVYSLVPMTLNHKWNPAFWGIETGGNLWRTTGDITDTWPSVSKIGFQHHKMGRNVVPGHWNDPDMLVVGTLGLAWRDSLAPTRLTPDEQVTHVTLWSMVAAPLLIGCDLSKLDQFTLDLLSNDEVIEVDQDPLGKPATRAAKRGPVEIWTRPLWDGTRAVAIFNRAAKVKDASISWKSLGIDAGAPVRDAWRQERLEPAGTNLVASIPPHGALLLKVGIASE